MSGWSDLVERLRTLVFRAREEREMNEEIAHHLEQEEARYREAGLSPDAARRRARLTFGGEQIKEEIRDSRGTGWFDRTRQDLRYAARTLVKQPGFTLVVVTILGLGIGANAATFTLIDALLLRPLPVPEPDRLVMVGNPARTNSMSEGTPRTDLISYPLFRDLATSATTVSGLYATGRATRLEITIPDSAGRSVEEPAGESARDPERTRARFVSGAYFTVLDMQAATGRSFTTADDGPPGTAPIAVISDAYWHHRFGGAPVLGRSILANGVALTIVGVMPQGFTGDIVGQATELWIPITMQPLLVPNRNWFERRDVSWLLLMGRLRPGVRLEQAQAELSQLVIRSLRDNATAADRPSIDRNLKEFAPEVGSGRLGFSFYRREFAPTLYLLAAAVALVLLVVAANLANLMLARGAARSREMQVRLSLGAGRGRVIQQLVTEGAVLATLGGALGLLIARIGTSLLVRLAGGGTPLPIATGTGLRVIGFVAAVSIGTVVLFAVLPALRTTSVELAGALRASASSIAGRKQRPGRVDPTRALVFGQVALSMVLLAGTGMVIRSMIQLAAADLGFDPAPLVIASTDLSRTGLTGPKLEALRRDLLERIGRIPGVQSVAVSENGVFSGNESGSIVTVEGFVARSPSDSNVSYDDVSADYFPTLGASVRLGRGFTPGDDTGPRVAIINRTMATFYFGSANPIGRHLTMDSTAWEIVGVVGDLKTQAIREESDRRVYLPMARIRMPPLDLVFEVKARGRPADLVPAVRAAITAADSRAVALQVQPLRAMIYESINQPRMAARVVAAFGGLALFLAALGLYGLLAYATVRRTNEFGLRMALGARPGNVARMVISEALGLVLAGAFVGVPGALVLARLFRSQWFGLPPVDWLSVGAAVGTLLLAAAVAASVPALRASRIAPLAALRSD